MGALPMPPSRSLRAVFSLPLGVLAVVLLVFFFIFVRYPDDVEGQVEQYWNYLRDVQVMVFIGFGFLMTFLRRYSYGAVALNYVMSAVVEVVAILVIGGVQQGIWNEKSSTIKLSMQLLIDSAFCAASAMIAFGAYIGKASPSQVLFLSVLLVPIYAFNQHLVIYSFEALDMGGTIVIHAFGAYYGLAASYMLSRNQINHGLAHPKNGSSYLNDITSMVGTVFLWIMWPSFNGALASVAAADRATATGAQVNSQYLCIVNTTLSLLGATISTFAMSAMASGRLRMVDVQNATLSGGVAMGAACTLRMMPGGALVVGLGAGVLSTLGFQYLTPFLDRMLLLGDSCGVHNLHGMPAVYGGLVAGLAALGASPDYLFHSPPRQQLGFQVVALAVTIGIAITGGLIGGYLSTRFNPTHAPPLAGTELFEDGVYWETEAVEDLEHALNANKSRHSVGSSQHPVAGASRSGRAANRSNTGDKSWRPNQAGNGSESLYAIPMGRPHNSHVPLYPLQPDAIQGTAYPGNPYNPLENPVQHQHQKMNVVHAGNGNGSAMGAAAGNGVVPVGSPMVEIVQSGGSQHNTSLMVHNTSQ